MRTPSSEIGQDFDFSADIREHLAAWGLRSFPSENLYYEWQRQMVAPDLLRRLTDLAEKRQGEDGFRWDQEFYDLASSSDLLPVLYSQRFGYFEQVGIALARHLSRLPSGAEVLDAGCGVGILTTWYASLFPEVQFYGIDRSSASLLVAERQAASLHLVNLCFTTEDISQSRRPQTFDGIIATQSLFQSEIDPGLPSQSWKSFDRSSDESALLEAEARTGLGPRLNGLLPRMKPEGTLFLFEKTLHLGRRVLFQRALSRRGLGQVQVPQYISYPSLGELETEGPLYVLSRAKPWIAEWEEAPRISVMDGLYRCGSGPGRFIYATLDPGQHDQLWSSQIQNRPLGALISPIVGGLILGGLMVEESVRGVIVGGASDEGRIRDILFQLQKEVARPEFFEHVCDRLWPAHSSSGPIELQPIFEDHTPVAQRVWEELPERHVLQSQFDEDGRGRARYIELGQCLGGWGYLYWANTFDQRQIVMMDPPRLPLLEKYFEESVTQL